MEELIKTYILYSSFGILIISQIFISLLIIECIIDMLKNIGKNLKKKNKKQESKDKNYNYYNN